VLLAQRLCQAGGLVFLALGVVHTVMIAVDMVRPRFFAPVPREAADAMRAGGIRLTPRVNVWRGWLGFNASHGLGLLVFGGGVLYLSSVEFGHFAAGPLLPASVLVALAYTALAVRFWFYAPATFAGLGLACLAGACVMVRAGPPG
jgi:hypothetical protein